MPTTEGIRQAIALLEDISMLKPSEDELRRARSWQAVLDESCSDRDLSLAVRRLARTQEKQYGVITPKQINNEVRRIRSERIHNFASYLAPPHPYTDPVLDLAYQRAYLAAIGDGLETDQADCEGQSATEMVQYILMTEPGTPEREVLARMSAAIADGQRPWREDAKRFRPHKPSAERRGGNITTGRHYEEIVAEIQERNRIKNAN